MRNFEERMNEIQKRSRARILCRRKQLTALSVSLVVAVCVCGVLLLRQPGIYTQTYSSQTTATIILEYSDNLPTLDAERSAKYTDKETVESIKSLIDDLVLIEDFTISTTRAFTAHTHVMSAHESYRFLLESEDGTTEYMLIGNTLVDSSAEAVYKLTDHQRVALLKLLELPVE